MSDASYNAKNYEKQGSTEWVIGGLETVYGTVDVKDGGQIKFPVVTEAVGTAMDGFGVSVCGSTKIRKDYSLGAPVAGALKIIEFTVSNATGYVTAGSTGYSIEDSKSSKNYLKATGNGSAILIGINSSKYALLSKSTSVSHTTSTT